MSWRGLSESWAQSWHLGGRSGDALRRTVETEAKAAAALAVELAREAVEAADQDRLGDALGALSLAGSEADQVMLVAPWPWWYQKRSVA